MGEFFRPLRRRIGVATLVAACAFVALWVRSLCSWDGLQFCSGKDTMEYFVSVDHSLIWGGIRIEDHDKQFMTMFHVTKNNYAPLDACLERMSLRCSWYGPGFGVGEPPSQLQSDWGIRCKYWIIPYWSAVFPLTLLSGWLLLRKRSVAKPDSGPT